MTTNSAAMQNPAVLMSKLATKDQKPPSRCSSVGSRPVISMVPMMNADGDGQPGDDQVVVDLADRPGERPAVGEVHEQAVQRVEQRHAAAEQERQRQHRVPGQALDGRAAVAASSTTSVVVSKPTPKISPTKYMCQVCLIERMNRPKNRYISPRDCNWRLEFGLVVTAPAHVTEDPDDAGQHDDVEQPRSGTGTRRKSRSRPSRRWSRRPDVRVDDRAEHRPGRDGMPAPTAIDDRRVAEGEEEPGGERPLAVGHQLAGGVVDGRDVVGVEGVPEAQVHAVTATPSPTPRPPWDGAAGPR